jgi:hypothetical protein
MALKSKPLEAVRPNVPVHEVSTEAFVRVNFQVPASMRKRWKLAAAQADRPLTDMLIESMNKYLNEQMSK